MNILVVRLGAMGDVIHTLPAAATLKQAFPDARLSWAIEPRWSVLLEGNPYVDEIVPIERRSLAAYTQMRKMSFDLAVDFQGLLKSAAVVFLAGSKRTFGFDRTRERLAGLFYGSRIRVSSAHVVDRNLELAAACGAGKPVLEFPLPAGAPEGEVPDGRFVLASPLAGWRSKQWPLEHYEQLASRLDVPLVLNGPPCSEAELRNAGRCRVHISGIRGLIDATRRAAAVIGVDSGPLHIAAALGKPGVAIFGPTDPARNGPYGQSLRVLRSPSATTSYKRIGDISPSMREITPEAVLAALQRSW